MNQQAYIIVKRLEARKKLLTSLLHDAPGQYVGQDIETGLYHGRVQKVFALVPLEHAEFVPQEALGVLRQRGLGEYITGSNMTPVLPAIHEELFLIETEMAWVKECGTA